MNHDPSAVLLATGFSVQDYQRARNTANKEAIANAIHSRFAERYIRPITESSASTHGFMIMAVSCLMIEALESFRQGLGSTRNRSQATFRSFFTASKYFQSFRAYSDDFYIHVRCGILHQAETTDGWRIRRTGPLLDSHHKIINATRFFRALQQELNAYCAMLQDAPWTSPEWGKARSKMDAITKNCKTS